MLLAKYTAAHCYVLLPVDTKIFCGF